MIEVTDTNFDELVKNSQTPVVVDFWATWCGPCRIIGPILEEIDKEIDGKVVIGKCNVDECSEVPMKFGIRNIPTLLFFKNGEVVDKMVGASTKAKIMEKINAL